MLPDRVSNPGPLTYESGALPIALRSPATEPLNLSEILFGDDISYISIKAYPNSIGTPKNNFFCLSQMRNFIIFRCPKVKAEYSL